MRSDGPISISRAFVAADWRRLLAEAGIPRTRTSIKWYFPFRYVVACERVTAGRYRHTRRRVLFTTNLAIPGTAHGATRAMSTSTVAPWH